MLTKYAGRDGRYSDLLSVRYFWVFAILLTPFLAGGVVVGDEALLLSLVRGVDHSALSFGDFVRSPKGFYVFHHILWFTILYVTSHIVDFFRVSPLVSEAILSSETVLAALAGVALCYTFLVRRAAMNSVRSLTAILAFFAGGYGVFTFCMGSTPESYMVLAMAARLFFVEPGAGGRAWKLAIVDAVLVALKAYSLIFIVIALPLFWCDASRKDRITYAMALGALLLALIAVKAWLWNPPPLYYIGLTIQSVPQMFLNFVAQIISPWTGILFCLPVLLVLFWHERSRRNGLFIKLAAILGCIAFFSTYTFFDGDVPGGRYIFPFTIALLPEIAAALSRLLDRQPRVAWLLPVAVFLFLPVGAVSFPFFPQGVIPDFGPCRPVHPVLYSWNVAIAKGTGQQSVEICALGKKYVMSPRDAASPHLGPWRVAYMLEGGHSEAYRAVAHDGGQRQHDAWGGHLSDRLRSFGLGNPHLWQAVGLTPAILVLLLSIWAAMRINRSKMTL